MGEIGREGHHAFVFRSCRWWESGDTSADVHTSQRILSQRILVECDMHVEYQRSYFVLLILALADRACGADARAKHRQAGEWHRWSGGLGCN